jgi:cytochrome c-type biogenesis protein CcmH/NrfG
MNKEFPLQIAMELTSTGQTSEAILAFEAHLQKNNTDSNAWRVMGRLHQEND